MPYSKTVQKNRRLGSFLGMSDASASPFKGYVETECHRPQVNLK